MTATSTTPAERVRTRRLDAGLSRSALALRSGVHHESIEMVETGQWQRPRAETVQRFAAGLDCQPTDLDPAWAPPAGDRPTAALALRALRRAVGWRQQDLATALGCSRAAVQGWEQGRFPTPHRALDRLRAEITPAGPDAAPWVAPAPEPEPKPLPEGGGQRVVSWHGRLVCHLCGQDGRIVLHGEPRPALPPITCGRCGGRLLSLDDLERRVTVTLADWPRRRPPGRPRKAAAA